MHLLLVDDNTKVRDELESRLRDFGINVTTAVNGLDGLAQTQQINFDAFIVDDRMPIMDGSKLINNLRKQSQYSFSPVLILTTRTEKELLVDLEMDEQILIQEKPITDKALQNFLDFARPQDVA